MTDSPAAAQDVVGRTRSRVAEAASRRSLAIAGNRLALYISLAYALVSVVWITFSDWALRITGGWATTGVAATAKGIGFVAATSVLLYAIISRGMVRIAAVDERLSSASSSLDLLVDQMPGFLWAVDRERLVTSLAGAGDTGAREEEVIDTMLNDAVSRSSALDAIDRALAGESTRFEAEAGGRSYETSLRPLRDSSGAITGAVALSLDRTEQVELGRRLAETQRVETVGQLASGIAHDFNNLLAAILGFTELARRTVPDRATLAALDHVREAGDRAALLTRRLLAFSRQQAIRPRVVDVNAVAAGLDAILRRLLGDEVALETSIDVRPCTVWIDPGQIEQIILNLAVNARDAMPGGGSLRIATRLQEDEGDPAVSLEIVDEGIGMDEITRAHAFDPFFTTKAEDGGTGLGLANVRAIVQEAGGTIELESAPNVGSRFLITLPFVGDHGREADEPRTAPGTTRLHSETVLVAEDEKLVRDYIRGLLRLEGFDVHAAGSGREALSLVHEEGRKVDVLVTDIAMPRMNGYELATRIREQHPGVAIVLLSGSADSSRPVAARDDDAVVFVAKPFTAAELIAAIELALDRR